MTQSRIQSLDILKLIAIFFVLWGHCIQYLLSSDHLDEPVYRFIYSFHMPLFMMIAGMFAGRSLSMSFGTFLSKKFQQLLLPCIVWGVLMAFANILQPLLTGRSVSTSVLTTVFTGNFWFLKSLFGCYLLAYIGQNTIHYRWPFYILSIIISQFIPYYSIQWMYPAFIMGVEISRHYEKLMQHSGKTAILSGIIFLGLIIACGNDMRTIGNTFVYHLYKIITGLSGSLALISLALLCERSGRNHFSWLSQWGGYTMGVYIIQCLVFIVQSRFLSFITFDTIPPVLFNAAIAPLLALLLLVGCLAVTWLLRQNKYTSYWLLGIRSTQPSTQP